MIMKITCITNIFNEEYLLPFWLEHHKKMFDHGIIVDYGSTDKSLDICRSICPEWTIINHDAQFDCIENDNFLMNIETGVDGFKIILNTTEFILSKENLKEILQKHELLKISIAIQVITPYSQQYYEPNTLQELFANLNNDDIKFHNDRWIRYIHNCHHGNYWVGRHETKNTILILYTHEIFIMWFGFYPLNEKLLQRKLQIKDKLSERDLANRFGKQHFLTYDDILATNRNKANTGFSMNQHSYFHTLFRDMYSPC
jgi:Glycosyl transferase family 2